MVILPATFDIYAPKFEERCWQHPTAWRVYALADIRCRLKFLPEEKRRQMEWHRSHSGFSLYNPSMPWTSVFAEAPTMWSTEGSKFRDPAFVFVSARGLTALA